MLDPSAARSTKSGLFCLILAILQFIIPSFSRLTGIGQSIEAMSNNGGLPAPEMPAGYAFSIWFFIFSLALLFAIDLPKRPPINRIFLLKINMLMLLSAIWMLLAQVLGDGWYLVVTIFTMWGLALSSFRQILEHPAHLHTSQYAIPMLGLYSGWLSVAVFLNLGSTLRDVYGWHFGLGVTGFAILTLAGAGAAALWLTLKTKANLWYATSIVWALVAVIVNNLTAAHDTTITCMAVGMLLGYLGLLIKMRRSRF